MSKTHYRSLLTLGLPIVIGQLGIIILGFADTVMIGHHSTDELAAASFVNNMFSLAIIFSTGFCYGLTPIVGNLFGQGRKQQVGTILRNALVANTLMATLVCGVMTLILLNLHRMGQPEELLPLMLPYYIILLLSMPFVLWFNGFKQFTDGITDTRISMWIMIGGNIFNIVGNYILIYGKLGMPEMGLIGAGIATLLSRILMVVAYVVIFFCTRRYDIYRQGFYAGSINRHDFVLLNKLGWPIAGQMGMETASFSLSAVMVGWLGSTALASHQIMITISQLFFMMYYGMGAAVSVLVSNYHGQHDMDNVKAVARNGFHIILVMIVMITIPIFMLRSQLGFLFTDSEEVSSLVAQLIIMLIIYQFGDGLQINYANALRGISDVRPLLLFSFIAYFVISLPTGYFFAFVLDWGMIGIWMAFPFGLTSAGIMYYSRFRYQTR